MADQTNISWADMTFNPVIGCARVSPACDGCYAAHMMETRFGRVTWGGPGKGVGTRVRTSPANWRKPLAWNRASAASGTRPFVFCASLADVFDNQWQKEWRRDLFDLIGATPNLIWLLLTKRPQNIIKMCAESGGHPDTISRMIVKHGLREQLPVEVMEMDTVRVPQPGPTKIVDDRGISLPRLVCIHGKYEACP